MTHKVSVSRRWLEPPPVGPDGKPIPKALWPRKRKHKWAVRWFGLDGHRYQATAETKQDAERIQSEKAKEFEGKPATRNVPRKVPLREFIDEFLELRQGPRGQRLRAGSLESCREALSRFREFIGSETRLVDLTAANAARFFNAVRTKRKRRGPTSVPLSPATVNRLRRTLKAAFNVAVMPLGYVRQNPFAGLRADKTTPARIRYVTPAEFAALLEACGFMPEKVWWRSFLTVCYSAGLRYSEAVNLTWADLDFASDTIFVTPKAETEKTLAWEPKDYELRSIPVPPELMTMLAELQEAVPDGHPYVFVPPRRLAFILAAKRAGFWTERQAVLNNFRRDFAVLVKRSATDPKSEASDGVANPDAEHPIMSASKPVEKKRRIASGADKAASASAVESCPRSFAPSLLDGNGRASVSIHDLRRSAITNWSKSANVQTVARLAGHSDVDTTMRYYAALTTDQLDFARQAGRTALRAAISRQTDAKVTQKPDSAGPAQYAQNRKADSEKCLE